MNAPFSKLLLEKINPVFMAALLYLGAGLGIGIIYVFHDRSGQEKLTRQDLPYVIGMILLDSIAPILLMAGIKLGTSSGAALIGNFEIAATAIFALLLFHEKISGVLCVAICFITISGLILSYDGGGIIFKGSLLVACATLCWGLENNCTRSIADKDTYQIVAIKGIFSGLCSLVTAIFMNESAPELIYIFPALLLGFISYGLSIFTYIRAQETLGAAKTSAYYAAGPFMGAIFSFVLLNESLSAGYITAFFIMLCGTLLVIYDTLKPIHTHEHTHTFTHYHGGRLHTHTITHTHGHRHYSNKVSMHDHNHLISSL